MEIVTAKRRKSLNPRTNWTAVETEEFVQLVLRMKDRFERPTAQVFYTQLAASEPILSYISWRCMRDKMRNLRNKYKFAVAWRSNNGADLDGEDQEQTIRDHMLKLCPQFDAMDELFGDKLNVDPLFTVEGDEKPLIKENSSISHLHQMKLDRLEAMTYKLDKEEKAESEKNHLEREDFLCEQELEEKSLDQEEKSLAEEMKLKQEEIKQKQEELKLKQEEVKLKQEEIKLKQEEMKLKQEEVKLKQEELNNKLILEKFRIEKEFELERMKIERMCDKKQD